MLLPNFSLICFHVKNKTKEKFILVHDYTSTITHKQHEYTKSKLGHALNICFFMISLVLSSFPAGSKEDIFEF